jgi:hypothetical protein
VARTCGNSQPPALGDQTGHVMEPASSSTLERRFGRSFRKGDHPTKLEPATTGDHPNVGAFPSWSPDGKHIAYTCEVGELGDNDLCAMNADGTSKTTILDTPANEAMPAWQPSGVKEPYVSSFLCPDLVSPGLHPRAAMQPAVEAYLDARQPQGADSYHYRIRRLHGRSELGFPEGDCPDRTWRRSFRVSGSFEYEEGATNQSASLAYFRVIAGRTEHGWVVWAELH